MAEVLQLAQLVELRPCGRGAGPGAVGSKPSLMRSGVPRPSFATSSLSTSSSSAPRLKPRAGAGCRRSWQFGPVRGRAGGLPESVRSLQCSGGRADHGRAKLMRILAQPACCPRSASITRKLRIRPMRRAVARADRRSCAAFGIAPGTVAGAAGAGPRGSCATCRTAGRSAADVADAADGTLLARRAHPARRHRRQRARASRRRRSARRCALPAARPVARGRSTSCGRASRCASQTDADGRLIVAALRRPATATCCRSTATASGFATNAAAGAGSAAEDRSRRDQLVAVRRRRRRRAARRGRPCSSPRSSPATSTSTTTCGAAIASRSSTRCATIDGEPVGAGRVVAAEFVNQRRDDRARSCGATPTAATTTTPTTARRCARRSCARRWSSPASPRASRTRAFTRSCKHWRAHKGVDYAAPHGHAGAATGDGMVDVRRARRAATATSSCCATSGVVHDASTRICRASRRRLRTGARVAPGRSDRLRRPDRLGDRDRTCTTSSASATSSAIR